MKSLKKEKRYMATKENNSIWKLEVNQSKK